MVSKNSEPLIGSVYARLQDLILSNALRAGQTLVDRELAAQLGVSPTPVRETLGRLAMMLQARDDLRSVVLAGASFK